MRRRALLAVFVALLLIGAYGAYVVSYPKYPEVKGCVNPFAVTKPIDRVQENWSKAHMFFKLATTRDFWKLAKPWDVDYSHVKIVKHTIEYNGERITMLAMGIPLKDKKHVIALYEFSKPVQGVKVLGEVVSLENHTTKLKGLMINGNFKTLDSCVQECGGGKSCGILERCTSYCCEPCSSNTCMAACASAGCAAMCGWIPWPWSVPCWLTCAGFCCNGPCCGEEGHTCEPITPGP
ncbi:hypothetical protein [Thermococcus sp. JdF3]|uniref:hypothetical protein n=1 Tax=Thermococcus sp. JdF3 TaxID=1638258 RepID=UPI00143B243C|nr:hypothetical protein [Thermococcus sp. JdF3]NJE00832.1 hypothetical protein [Thermococcus sp. JdF3]